MTNSSGDQTTEQDSTSNMPDSILGLSESRTVNQPHLGGTVQPVANPTIANVDTPRKNDVNAPGSSQAPTATLSQPNKIDEVLSHNGPVIEKPVEFSVDHEREFRNVSVVLKPIPRRGFRLNLEKQPENFTSFPGSTFRYAPKIVGEMFRTGLNRPEMGKTIGERRQRQAWLELQLGRPLDAKYYGELSFIMDRNSKTGEKLSLWKAFDFIIYLSMLESDQVANGLHEYNNGSKPFAEWYVENKEAEAETKASGRQRSLTILTEFGKISEQKKRNLAIMAGCEVLGLSALAVSNELWGWVEAEDKPQEKPKRQEVFLSWLDMGDSYINVSALVKSAVKFNLLRKNGAGDYYYGNDLLGSVEDDVVKKLLLPQSGDIRKALQDKVDFKIS